MTRVTLTPWLTVGVLATLAPRVAAQGPARMERLLRADRVDDRSIQVDGHLEEPGWQRAAWTTGFTQRDPEDGSPARERTEFRVLVSGEAIFIGVRAFDSDPGAIVGRLARRDEIEDIGSSSTGRVSSSPRSGMLLPS